jgi:hypothetical protein
VLSYRSRPQRALQDGFVAALRRGRLCLLAPLVAACGSGGGVSGGGSAGGSGNASPGPDITGGIVQRMATGGWAIAPDSGVLTVARDASSLHLMALDGRRAVLPVGSGDLHLERSILTGTAAALDGLVIQGNGAVMVIGFGRDHDFDFGSIATSTFTARFDVVGDVSLAAARFGQALVTFSGGGRVTLGGDLDAQERARFILEDGTRLRLDPASFAGNSTTLAVAGTGHVTLAPAGVLRPAAIRLDLDLHAGDFHADLSAAGGGALLLDAASMLRLSQGRWIVTGGAVNVQHLSDLAALPPILLADVEARLVIGLEQIGGLRRAGASGIGWIEIRVGKSDAADDLVGRLATGLSGRDAHWPSLVIAADPGVGPAEAAALDAALWRQAAGLHHAMGATVPIRLSTGETLLAGPLVRLAPGADSGESALDLISRVASPMIVVDLPTLTSAQARVGDTLVVFAAGAPVLRHALSAVDIAAGHAQVAVRGLVPDRMTVLTAAIETAVGLGGLSNPLRYTLDTTPPSLSISTTAVTLILDTGADIVFRFDREPVAGFDRDDVVVVHGQIGPLSGGDAAQVARFTPAPGIGAGEAVIMVPAGSYADVAGNPGLGATLATVLRIDTLPPSGLGASLVDITAGGGLDSDIAVRFDETIRPGSGVVTLRAGSANGAILESFDVAESGRLRFLDKELRIDPTDALPVNKTLSIELPAQTIQDPSGNGMAAVSIVSLDTRAHDIAWRGEVDYVETRAGANQAWRVNYDLYAAGGLVVVGTRVHVHGASVDPIVLDRWEVAVEKLWDGYALMSPERGYKLAFDLSFVSALEDPHYVVHLREDHGQTTMLRWHLQTDWGPNYLDKMIAHEFGHMIGAFDEYAGGALLGGETQSGTLMADLTPVLRESYIAGIELQAEFLARTQFTPLLLA